MDKPALLSQIQCLHLPHLIVRSFRISGEQEHQVVDHEFFVLQLRILQFFVVWHVPQIHHLHDL